MGALEASIHSAPATTLDGLIDEGRDLDSGDAVYLPTAHALIQADDEGKLHPIGYWSRVLSDTEANYTTPEREGLAIVWALCCVSTFRESTLLSAQTRLRYHGFLDPHLPTIPGWLAFA